jgi:TIR domain
MRLSQPHDLAEILRETLVVESRPPKSAAARPQVFIAYVLEDEAFARRLCLQLEKFGLDPWMDQRKLKPGENWLRAIDSAIENSRFFLACLSSRSVDKRSRFQAELRYALDCAVLMPPNDIFFIPVRLDACRVPLTIARTIQYVDLFPDWDHGFTRVLDVIREQLLRDIPPPSDS